ncbi:hypothetical protein NKDENANG_00082 [Candidatus Entotheonellaceae bacterium PAL068K]
MAAQYGADFAYEISRNGHGFGSTCFRDLYVPGAGFWVIPSTLISFEELNLPLMLQTLSREKGTESGDRTDGLGDIDDPGCLDRLHHDQCVSGERPTAYSGYVVRVVA